MANVVNLHGFDYWINGYLAVSAARNQHREFFVEGNPLFGVQFVRAQRSQRSGNVARAADDSVTAPIVSQPFSLHHEGIAKRFARL